MSGLESGLGLLNLAVLRLQLRRPLGGSPVVLRILIPGVEHHQGVLRFFLGGFLGERPRLRERWGHRGPQPRKGAKTPEGAPARLHWGPQPSPLSCPLPPKSPGLWDPARPPAPPHPPSTRPRHQTGGGGPTLRSLVSTSERQGCSSPRAACLVLKSLPQCLPSVVLGLCLTPFTKGRGAVGGAWGAPSTASLYSGSAGGLACGGSWVKPEEGLDAGEVMGPKQWEIAGLNSGPLAHSRCLMKAVLY